MGVEWVNDEKNALGNRLYSEKMTDDGVGQQIRRNKTKTTNHKTAIFTFKVHELHYKLDTTWIT